MPKVIIFAGANGTGKTTLAKTVIGNNLPYVNADEIKRIKGLNYIEAGKAALTEIDRCILKEISFSFEATMAGLTLLRKLKWLKNKGYNVTIFYLFVASLDLLRERIKERVKKGGHNVEYKDVVRRFYRSAKNFWYSYKTMANEWVIIQNNEFKYRIIAVGSNSTINILDEEEFKKFKEVLPHGK